MGALDIAVALLSRQMTDLLVFAFTIRATGPFTGYLFGLLCDAPPRRAGFIIIIIGTARGLAWQLIGQPWGIFAIIVGALAGLISYLLGWLWVSHCAGRPSGAQHRK